MPNRDRPSAAASVRAFTLIELLAVIAIIGILAAILIPTVSGANNSAKKAKTRVMFSQWATAIEGFRQEYGFYPTFPSEKVNGDGSTTAQIVQFREVLTGRGTNTATNPPGFLSTTENGSSPQNKKRIAFLSFGQGDLSGNLVQDAFGKTEIAVLMDKNQDGMIKIETTGNGGDYQLSEVPAVGGLAKPLSTGSIVRAGVIFYSPGVGSSAGDIVKSWE